MMDAFLNDAATLLDDICIVFIDDACIDGCIDDRGIDGWKDECVHG